MGGHIRLVWARTVVSMLVLIVLAFMVIPFYMAGLVGNGAVFAAFLLLGAAAYLADRGPVRVRTRGPR